MSCLKPRQKIARSWRAAKGLNLTQNRLPFNLHLDIVLEQSVWDRDGEFLDSFRFVRAIKALTLSLLVTSGEDLLKMRES